MTTKPEDDRKQIPHSVFVRVVVKEFSWRCRHSADASVQFHSSPNQATPGHTFRANPTPVHPSKYHTPVCFYDCRTQQRVSPLNAQTDRSESTESHSIGGVPLLS